MSRLRLIPCLLLLPIAALPCALLARPALAGPAKHAKKVDAKEQISALEEQWRTASLSGDVSTIEKLLSDDYVGISWNGQVNTKSSQLDRLRDRSLVISRLDLSDVKIKVVNSVAIVTCRADLDAMNDGQQMKGSFLYTRIYQRLPAGGWKITNFEATRVPPQGHGRGSRQAATNPPPAAAN